LRFSTSRFIFGHRATYNDDPEDGVCGSPVLRLRDCAEDAHHILMAMYRRKYVHRHSIIFQSAVSPAPAPGTSKTRHLTISYHSSIDLPWGDRQNITGSAYIFIMFPLILQAWDSHFLQGIPTCTSLELKMIVPSHSYGTLHLLPIVYCIRCRG